MANPNNKNGFTPVRYADGTPYNGVGRWYWKGVTAGPICVGDRVVRKTGSASPSGGPEIIRATVGANMTGVVVGMAPNISNLNQVPGYMAAADTGYVRVEDDPTVIFEVQETGVGTALATTDVGKHINTSTAADGNSAIGRSTDGLDNNAKSTGNEWIIVSLADKPNNSLGLYAKWLVKPNLHTEVNAGAANVKEI